jgi:hypothetical protein
MRHIFQEKKEATGRLVLCALLREDLGDELDSLIPAKAGIHPLLAPMPDCAGMTSKAQPCGADFFAISFTVDE